MKKTLSALAGAGLMAAAVVSAPTAAAYPWWMGSCFAGNTISVMGYGFCDGPPVNPAGDHYHCETAPFYHGCMWKDAANLTIGMPPGVGY